MWTNLVQKGHGVRDQVVVGVHEAKTHFSKLVKRAQEGDEVIVESYGKPVARIVALSPARTPRRPGTLAGRLTIKPGFDELPEGFEDAFDG
jgi:prevent-host-death family protein